MSASAMAYKRADEGPAAVFYKAYASYFPESPPSIKRFVDEIEKRTNLARRGSYTWPTDPETIETTAKVFEELGDGLDLEDSDSEQLDRFAISFLIDPVMRAMFTDGQLTDEAAYGDLIESEGNRIADEPLLHYAMGCFWGEWLVRHTDSSWHLYAPLDPVQSFPDMLRTGTLTTLSPFSLATKLLANPAGDALAPKVATMPDEVLFGPVALCASISDSEQILHDIVGDSVVRATKMLADGDADKAFEFLEDALDANPGNGHLLQQSAALGWDHRNLAFVHRATFLQLHLVPESAEVRHNFAAIESMREGGLESAIEMLEALLEDQPEYARGHLTLGSCYLESGRKDDARLNADWILEHAPEMADAARQLLAEIDSE
jgi:tetratricopeptide (TPR) repeat protein